MIMMGIFPMQRVPIAAGSSMQGLVYIEVGAAGLRVEAGDLMHQQPFSSRARNGAGAGAVGHVAGLLAAVSPSGAAEV